MTDTLDRELAGNDALESALHAATTGSARRVVRAVLPKIAAIAAGIALWQLVASSGWKPSYLFPGPIPTLHHLWQDRSVIGSGVATTLRRAVEFYAVALVAGTAVAVVVTRSRLLRDAVTPLLSGLQTMPNVAWVHLKRAIAACPTLALLVSDALQEV